VARTSRAASDDHGNGSSTGLQERLGPLDQIVQPGLGLIDRFARMNDSELAAFRCLDQLCVAARPDVGDVGLLVAIIGEHAVIDLCAFVAGRATLGFDIGFVG